MLVRGDAARLFVLDNLAVAGDFLLHELVDERVLHQPRAPNHDTRGNLVSLLLDANLEHVAVAPDALEVVLRLDLDALAAEALGRVVGQVLVKHGQHLGRNVVDGDVDKLHERRVHLAQILVDEVVQLGRVLYARRSATHDGEVQQLAALLVGGDGQVGLFKRREHAGANVPGVADVAQKIGMLRDALDAKRLAVAPDGDDELVVGNVELGPVDGLDARLGARVAARVGLEADRLVGKVDARRPRLVELVDAQAADGLNGRAELERADGRGGQ